MKNYKSLIGLGLMAASASVFATTCCEEEGHSSAEAAVLRQVDQQTRQINNIIAQHLYAQFANTFASQQGSVSLTNKMAASADSSSVTPWGSLNIFSLTADSATDGLAQNVYQFIGGVDKRFGDLFIGTTLTYAYGDTDILGGRTDSHNVALNPYIAYKLTDYLFLSGILGYDYTSADKLANLDNHEYLAEANINAYKVIDSVILKGRAGVRYSHFDTTFNNSGTENGSDAILAIVDVEAGYSFDNGAMVFTGFNYQYNSRNRVGALPLNGEQNAFYFRAGAEYQISDGLSINAKIETDLNDSQYSLIAGTLGFRMEL